ncbi:MAG: energy transducer TonB, partial [Saprospiraceae bacterium]
KYKQEKKVCAEKIMMSFINQNIKYPEDAKKNAIEGVAVAQFIVEKDGSLSDVKIVKNPGGGTGEEVARLISQMPNWNPGKHEGKLVRTKFILPVRFKLGDGE